MKIREEKYDQFASRLCRELQKKQDVFRERYNFNKYENWFYNEASEILRLYNDDDEIYFQYLPLGTYSLKSKTWMWVWENDEALEPRRNMTQKIKEFGEQRKYEKLYNGYFEGDEYTGWELTGISFKLLGGLGAYKTSSDQLEKYMLLTNLRTKEEVEEIESKLIECNNHVGKFRKTFICQHLFDGSGQGFEEAFETSMGMELEEDDYLQAWCSNCEIERLKTDGWNDESMKFAKIKIVCEVCYFGIKENMQN